MTIRWYVLILFLVAGVTTAALAGVMTSRLLDDQKENLEASRLIVVISTMIFVIVMGMLGVWVTRRIARPLERLEELEKDAAHRAHVLGEEIKKSKSTEQDLRDSETRFRNIVEGLEADFFFYTLDAAGRVIYTSSSVEAVLGYPPASVGDDLRAQLTSSSSNAVLSEHRKRVLGGEKQPPLELEFRHAHGSHRWVEILENAVFDESGVIVRIEGIARDRTDRRDAEDAMLQARDELEMRVRERTRELEIEIEERRRSDLERQAVEDQLRQAQKMDAIGQLAGGVSHDFNNLLTVVIGYGESIKAKLDRDDPLYPAVGNILEAADRASSLTKQLLAFSRRQPMRLVTFDPSVQIANVGKMLVRLIGEEIRLRLRTPDTASTVCMDPTQFDQIILNLALNARDAMRGGGELVIATEAVEHRGGSNGVPHDASVEQASRRFVRITVSDSGCGMSESVRERLFEPFFSTKDSSRGTGLGLSVVYGIVTQAGGTIAVESAEGAGSTFTVELPCANGVAENPESPRSRPGDRIEGSTILVVEDEPELRELIDESLAKAGHTTLRAADGMEAMEVLEGHAGRVDMVVTDVVMPRMNGLQLERELRISRPETRVLFISGFADDRMAAKILNSPGVNLIEKPFTMRDLETAVAGILASEPTRP